MCMHLMLKPSDQKPHVFIVDAISWKVISRNMSMHASNGIFDMSKEMNIKGDSSADTHDRMMDRSRQIPNRCCKDYVEQRDTHCTGGRIVYFILGTDMIWRAEMRLYNEMQLQRLVRNEALPRDEPATCFLF